MPDGAKLSGVSKPAMKKEGEGVGAGRGDKAGQTGSVDTRSPTDRKFLLENLDDKIPKRKPKF